MEIEREGDLASLGHEREGGREGVKMMSDHGERW